MSTAALVFVHLRVSLCSLPGWHRAHGWVSINLLWSFFTVKKFSLVYYSTDHHYRVEHRASGARLYAKPTSSIMGVTQRIVAKWHGCTYLKQREIHNYFYSANWILRAVYVWLNTLYSAKRLFQPFSPSWKVGLKLSALVVKLVFIHHAKLAGCKLALR